jgi:hypothetical protein
MQDRSVTATPDYAGLIRFLVQPFLESPDALRIDCEVLVNRSRVWVRLAFEGTDKGRVFGRGGRNIQAIRTVVDGIAKSAGQSVHLDIFGIQSGAPHREDGSEERPHGRPSPRSAPRRPSR